MSESFFDELPDVDRRSCRLLGPTALIVQGLMGVLVISSLLYKRHREEPKRPWRIWLFDVSKQVIGQMFVHGINVLISDVVANLSFGNACVLYFLNILIDTTLGVGVIYFVLHGVTYLLTEKCHLKGFESGKYGSPPSFNYWIRQAAVYMFALTTMKLIVVALFAVWPGVFRLGEWLLDFLGPSDALQVIFTMGLFPILMNIIQFWLIDSIVKASGSALALPTESARGSIDSANEPLFQADPDEDEDDDGEPPRHDIENPAPRSVSRSRDDSVKQAPDESKSFGSEATTAAGSGSNTPLPKVVDSPSAPVDIHAYPPSLASTATTPASSFASSLASRAKSVSPHPRRTRKSPPPVLPLYTIHHAYPAHALHVVDSADSLRKQSPRIVLQPEEIPNETDWAAWGDGEDDDWADRVGEEDWTGRRMEGKRDALHEVWARAHSAGELGAEP